MEDKKKLLREYFLLEVKEGHEGPLKLKGIFSIANKPNQNGRIYPRTILEREATKFSKLVEQRRAIGELDHPDVSVVMLQNASHVITDMHWDGDNLMGEIEVLPTRNGQVLEALVRSKIPVGLSSRAVGGTVQNADGHEVVQEDLQLLTFDVVSNPSVAEAILSEGLILERQKENRIHAIGIILDDILGIKQ